MEISIPVWVLKSLSYITNKKSIWEPARRIYFDLGAASFNDVAFATDSAVLGICIFKQYSCDDKGQFYIDIDKAKDAIKNKRLYDRVLIEVESPSENEELRVREVFPKQIKTEIALYDPEQLIKLVKAAKVIARYEKKETGAPYIYHNSYQAAYVVFPNLKNFIGLIMPVKFFKPLVIPTWLEDYTGYLPKIIEENNKEVKNDD